VLGVNCFESESNVKCEDQNPYFEFVPCI